MDWGKLLGTAAPTIATMLGGPLAGSAVTMLAKEVMKREDATEQEVYDAIKADPQAMAKVKIAEVQAEASIADADTRSQDSAREMHISLKDATTPILSWLIVFGFFSMVGAILLNQVNLADKQLAYILVGYVSAEMTKVTNFYFGSSRGSRNKDVMKYAPSNFGGAIGKLFKKKA